MLCSVVRELRLVLCDNLEGWDGVGGRKEIQERGNTCIPMGGASGE